MKKLKKVRIIRIVALFLALVLAVPSTAAFAAVEESVQPFVSVSLISYGGVVQPLGGGKVQIDFSVSANQQLDELGALTIRVYESPDNVSWDWVYTFIHNSYAGMIEQDTSYHSGNAVYYGIPGRYYKAYIFFRGVLGTVTKTQYLYTSPILAS